MTIINTKEEFENLRQLEGSPGIKDYTFDDCTFNFSVSIFQPDILHFENCIFNEKFELRGKIKASVNIQSCIFNKVVKFENTTFENKVRIQGSSFEDTISFDNTKFSELCDFWNTIFKKTTIFYKTDFLKTTVFSRTQFYENVLFTYTLIEKVAIFRGATFKKGLDLSTSILNGSLSLFDFELNDYITVKESYNEDEYETMISETGEITEKSKQETFRIIKKQFDNQKNNIKTINYLALELNGHLNELKRKSIFEKGVFEDYIIHYLNKWSNANGKSWGKGVIFTLTIALFLFSITLVTTDKYEIGFELTQANITNFSKLFFEYLTPTHKVDFLDINGSNVSTYLFDFIGRIFIAYGIYQTVQAFRKYRS